MSRDLEKRERRLVRPRPSRDRDVRALPQRRRVHGRHSVERGADSGVFAVDLQPDTRAPVDFDAPPVGELVDERQSEAVLQGIYPVSGTRFEAGPLVAYLDAYALRRAIDPDPNRAVRARAA